MKVDFKGVMVILLTVFFSFSANGAALEPRYGGQAYYDPDSGVTFLTNTNSEGLLTFADAVDWAFNLNIGGITNWQLPNGISGSGSFDYLANTRNISSSNPGPFQNLSGNYWSREIFYNPFGFDYDTQLYQYNSDDNFSQNIFRFLTRVEGQPTITAFAWAVHDGDPLRGLSAPLSSVPLPAAVWMFGTVIAGFIGFRRKKMMRL